MSMRQPTFFLSHGAPTLLLEENITTRFWQGLPSLLQKKPRAILCISAHWDTPQLRLSGTLCETGIQHDFYGFPKALYDIRWHEQQDDETATWLRDRLRKITVDVVEDNRPKDHGVWLPLKMAWPAPTFPVYQLSLSLTQGLDSHWLLGQKLSELRNEGILIIGSGGITHNLGKMNSQAPEGSTVPWATDFVDALELAIRHRDRALLCQPWQLPFGKACHPTVEHYAPFLVMMGAANEEPVRAMHHSWMYGSIALHAYGAGL